MRRRLTRNVALAVCIAALLGGGTAVAIAATGGGRGHSRHARSGAHHGSRLLQAAAAYIGVSREALVADLRSGQSLVQVAQAAGKSEAGLIEALGKAVRARLDQRLSTVVNRTGGSQRAGHGRVFRQAAANYLGISQAALAKAIHNGQSPAQLAAQTPRHSAAGLIEALVAAARSHRASVLAATNRATRPAAKHAGGKHSRQNAGHLRKRASRYANRAHSASTHH